MLMHIWGFCTNSYDAGCSHPSHFLIWVGSWLFCILAGVVLVAIYGRKADERKSPEEKRMEVEAFKKQWID